MSTQDLSGRKALRADMATDRYGVTGEGLKIGIISDSFNVTGGYAGDVANGLLPAGVNVVQEGPSGSSDEGRAMAQLIYDIAPGATLDFASAFNGGNSFADNILALQQDGCNIIVDDVSDLTQPFYQLGSALQSAVEQVCSLGVSYFTSAGNEGSNYVESGFIGEASSIAGIGLVTAAALGNGQVFEDLSITQGREAYITLEWDQPYASISGTGSSNSLALFLFDANGTIVASSAYDEVGSDPVQFIDYTNTTASSSFRLSVVLNGGTVAPGLFKFVVAGSGQITDSNRGQGSGDLLGQQLVPAANTVGAIYDRQTPAFGSTPFSESFSSQGGGTLLFDANGNRLATAVNLGKVDFSATDGGSTSVFNPFFGTSAAAPQAAAVAALVSQANPRLTNADLTDLLKDSATVLPFNSTVVAGAGLIQADVAVGFAVTGTITAFNGGNTTLFGTSLGDDIVGSGADDIVIGGGSNTIDGGAGGSVVDYARAPAAVTVDLTQGTAANGFGGTDRLVRIGGIIGSAFDDRFVVATPGRITGGGGSDTLVITQAGSLDLSQVSGVGTIDLSGSATNTLSLTGTNFADAPGRTLTVIGGAHGNTLSVAQSAGDTLIFSLDGSGPRLSFSTDPSGANIIIGFASNDLIALPNAAATGANYQGGTLQVTNGHTPVTTVLISGPAPGTVFEADPAPGGGTLVREIACFVRGTRIMTTRGPVAVERLRAGMSAVCVKGGMRPIRWIGRRTVGDSGRARDMPIRIQAGAICANLPQRDLLVSPDHGIHLAGGLIPARLLVNGATIRPDLVDRGLVYYHVELDRHDLLLAEGLAVESYFDAGNRAGFDNGRLHPADIGHTPGQAAEECAPLLYDGPVPDTVRADIAQRASELGWTGTDEPDLHLIADGTRVDPFARAGVGWRFDLPRPRRALWLASRCSIPGYAGDRRSLGVAITRIALRGNVASKILLCDHPALTDGFHELDGAWRWTEGLARLPVRLTRHLGRRLTIEVDVAGVALYRAPPAARIGDPSAASITSN